MAQQRPNILIFMTDQQRGDTIPPYSRAITPHIDQFCMEGVTFSQAYTSSPHCCPSRTTFFTGKYPSEHGVWNNVQVGNALSRGPYEHIRMWSEDLKEAGYELFFSGKWHVDSSKSPEAYGWNIHPDGNIVTTQMNKKVVSGRPVTYDWDNYLKLKDIASADRKEGEIQRPGYGTYVHYGVDEDPFRDRETVEEAVEQILSRPQSAKPWCQYIGTLGPHDPYFVPQKYLDMYDIEDIELPESFYDTLKDKPNLYRRTRDRFDQLSEREHREAIRHYLAFCTYQDALFGKVLDALEMTGEKDNTVVLFLSDHGDYMAEHGLWCKGLPCFRSAYHIPCSIRWPRGVEDPGRVVDHFITLADFGPTFLQLAETTSSYGKLSGDSLVPFLKNQLPDDWRDAVFTQSNGNELYGIQRSVMTREWKYVYNGFDYDELYDLQNDPHECRNLIDDPKYQDVVRALSRRLWKFAYEKQDTCINSYIMVGLAPYGPGEAFRGNST